MNERINTGYEFPEQTKEEWRRSQAHWLGIDPDEWWEYCQAIVEPWELRTWNEFKTKAIEAENDFGRSLR